MNDCPAASVNVLLSNVLDVAIEAETKESGRKDVKGSGSAVLDDDN